MTPCRTVACALLLALTLVPAMGLAAGAIAAAPGQHLQRQAQPAWRTVPSTVTRPALTPSVAPVEHLAAPDAPVAVPLVVRIPFIPPRG